MDFEKLDRLLEAIKAKLKNWESIGIIYLPKELVFQSQFGHFLWRNNKTDEYFHFTRNWLSDEHYCPLLIKGFIEHITKHDVEKQADGECCLIRADGIYITCGGGHSF